MNPPVSSQPALPLWARIADGLVVVLALAALYVTVFGGIRIGSVFSMSTPWRALIGLTIICGLRHYLVRTSPLHERVGGWLRSATARLRKLATRCGEWRLLPLAQHVARRIPRVRGRIALPGSRPPDTPGAARFEALHIVALWSIAVAQPIFDLVGRGPEFLIAYDTRPGDLLVLVGLLCLGGPACCVLATLLAGVAGGRRWRQRAAAVAIGGLAGVVALAAFKSLDGWSAGLPIGLAALAGAVAAGAYQRFQPIRMFATLLAPAAIVVPAVFLLSPGVSRLLAPAGETGALDGVTFDATPPVVVVAFDQFQLAALLDRAGNVDRATFPHFAGLADDATWFRNGSAVGTHTTFALPAMLTGKYPSPGKLPIAADHPNNLFTLLGDRYRLHVEEPLTKLCPETLCPPERAAFNVWITGVLRDLAVVYLRVVLPDELAAPLPEVNQTWNDFGANETFIERWQEVRVDDRREAATRFIESITAARGPVLHFLHVLLPHEPWLYLPTGQQFTFHRHNIGLREGRWADDSWAAALNYQRYLLQVGYADTLLGKLVARLRETGIYDDALIIIAADHGASLRPGLSFRRPEETSFDEIAAVPFFVKQPGQRRGAVVDANVEVIDIVPTVAAALGTALPWAADGQDVLGPARDPRSMKLMYVDGARKRVEAPGDLRAAVIESAARKFDWLETGNPLDAPTPGGRYGELIGEAADELRAPLPSAIEVVVDALPLMQDVDPQADFVPAHITGAVAGLPDGAPPPLLAIALNGVVAAVTRPYAFPVVGRRGAWEAIVHPRQLVSGSNTLEVFEIREDSASGAVRLAAVLGDAATNRWPNLVRDEEIQILGGQTTGFYGTEWARARPFRWTRGDARLLLPLDPDAPPATLSVSVLITGGPKQLRITVEDCTLFDETIVGGWSADFGLDNCSLVPPDLEIGLWSDTHVPSARDTRTLGVAVGRIELRGPVPEP